MIPRWREFPWLLAVGLTTRRNQCTCGRSFRTRSGLWLHRLQAGDRP